MIYNIDPYIDVERFKSLHERICYGISISNWNIGGTAGPEDRSVPDVLDVCNNTDYYLSRFLKDDAKKEEIKDNVSGMDRPTKLKYLSLLFECKYFGFSIAIRATNNYFNINKSSNTFPTENGNNFSELLDYVYEKLPFAEVGRIVIFLTPPGMQTHSHKDHSIGTPLYHEFIWLTPTDKKFFVKNSNGEKQYAKSSACWFDSSYYHGTEPTDHTTYSIRVDGQFKSDFREQLFRDQGYPEET